MEINEVFQTNDFPVLDALYSFDPRYIPKSTGESAAKNVSIVFDWDGINKINVYDGLRKESAVLIGCARVTFLNEFKSYSTSTEIKRFENAHIVENDLKKSLQKKAKPSSKQKS